MSNAHEPLERTEKSTGKRILAVAARPGDETLGCGGSLVLHAEAGDSVKVVILARGAGAGNEVAEDPGERPEGVEAARACGRLGVHDVEFWGYAPGDLIHSKDLVVRLAELLKHCRPDRIYAVSPLETDPCRGRAASAVAEAVRVSVLPCRIAFCEVECAVEPTERVDISAVVDRKRSAAACYRSLEGLAPLLEACLGLNRFRALAHPLPADHVEAFSVWTSERLMDVDAAVLVQPRLPARAGSGMEDGPLVSIIIRTKDRPQYLVHAIRSVASQTYTNLELVVVNDGGRDVKDLVREEAAGIPVRWVEHAESRGRAAAANSGLQEARGRLLNFLDDDDVLYPQHVETLVSRLQATDAKVVYAGTRNVYFDGPPEHPDSRVKEEVVFNRPFDPDLLLFENYIPTMTVLFSREILDRVVGFCESMDLFEDWDFWVRVSRIFPFTHVDAVTSEYRFYGSSSVESSHHRKYAYRQALMTAFERFHGFMSGKAWAAFFEEGMLGRLRREVQGLGEENERLKNYLAASEVQRGALADEVANLKGFLAASEEIREALSTEVENLKTFLSACERERQGLHEEIERYQSLIHAFELSRRDFEEKWRQPVVLLRRAFRLLFLRNS